MSDEKKEHKTFKVEKRELLTPLTDKEKEINRVKVMMLLDQIDKEKLEAKAEADKRKEGIKQLDGTVRTLRAEIQHGVNREVEVQIESNWSKRLEITTRQDTDEIIHRRKISESEAQMHIGDKD